MDWSVLEGTHPTVTSELCTFIRQQHARYQQGECNGQLQNTIGPCRNHVLLSGLSGMGKTVLGKALSFSPMICDIAKVEYVSCTALFGSGSGNIETRLADLFVSDRYKVLILDDISVIAMGGNALRDTESRVLSILQHMLDHTRNVVVVGIGQDLSPNLLRNGRFGKKMLVSISTVVQRKSVLEYYLYNQPVSCNIERLARLTAGYSAADLGRLSSLLCVDQLPMETALGSIRPAIFRNLPMVHVVPKASAPIVAVDHIKNLILAAIDRRCGSNEASANQKDDRGILLYGPSGCGKTAIALECIRQSGINTVHVQATMIRSMILGQSEKNLAALFDRVRAAAPTILFIDEIDALFATRQGLAATDDRLITCLLTELDGLLTVQGSQGDRVLVLAATARKECIDPAILRKGRIGTLVSVGPLDFDGVLQLVRERMQTMRIAADDSQKERLARRLLSMTGAQIANFFTEAAMTTLRLDPESQSIPLDLLGL